MAATPRSEARAGLKLISPTAIYVIVLLALPLATVMIYSVMTGGRGNVSLPLTFENYAELWSKPVYGFILLKSLL
ncbi:MAG: ABC transporter permease, partial [Tabrizicola sp.]